MELARNPNYRGETYPCEGEPQDRARGLLADCGKRTPFLDGMVSLLDKEASPMVTKFIQGYYDIPEFERGERGTQFLVSIQDGTGRAKDLVDHKIQLPNTLQVALWYYGFNWLDPVVGAGSNPAQGRAQSQAAPGARDRVRFRGIHPDLRGQPRGAEHEPGRRRTLRLR
jgi:hypothetical protein